MADGYIEFSTTLDNSDLEKQLKETEAEIDRLKKKIEQRESDRNAIADAMEEADIAIKETEANIAQLEARFAEVMAEMESGKISPDIANARIDVITAELKKQRSLYDQQVSAADKLNQKWDANEQEIADLNASLGEATERGKLLAFEYAKNYNQATAVLNSGMQRVNEKFKMLGANIAANIRGLLGLGIIFGLFSSLKSYIQESIQSSNQFAAAANGLRAVLAGLATPILAVVISAFTAMVRVISAVLITLARLVDSIFKTNFVGAIVDAQNSMIASANAQEGATKATDNDTKATKRNTKAKKEATRWLAAFDELNVMNKKDEDNEPLDNVGSNIPSVGGGGGAPDWAGIDVGKIDATLAEIMLILGAALLAVGAILAFSGINIPLGLTLMVIGALMIYTAAQEQWDKLPQEVRDAINGVLVFTGVLMLVIGAVLAFSHVNTALGIGMMAAGALLLWTAVALNWEYMPAEIQNAATWIMGILSVALLVIGAVLAFSMANPFLGLGLMALGAASLAAVVAINWDSMPQEIQNTITQIAAIVGVAFLSIGAVLALTSPAGVGLGVGLLLIGAASLAASVALQWDYMPQQVRDAWSVIGAIIGAGLLVLGIILIVSGVGLPLGLALILAGAGSIAAAVAVNFDAIRQKAAEVWQSLKSWFSTYVAPVFTADWWFGLFKGIVNGLIEALNCGLNAFGGFINDLGSGLSDILNFFGVSGYSFSIGMPQIPYLAQGAVIPPNRRFMAVLGDQTNGTNLEAPESLIRQIVREESGVGNGEIVMLLSQMLTALQARQTIECDGYTLARVVNNQNRINRNIYGA